MPELTVVADDRPNESKELTAEQILAGFKRELRPVDVPNLGRVYVYEPRSAEEWDAYYKHVRFDKDGATVSVLGIVDGIIAQVRDKAGRTLFGESDRQRLLGMPVDTLLDIWRAIGGDAAG